MKNEIIKTIQKLAGKYAPETVFSDWVKCMAISIQNSLYVSHDKLWQQREDEYISAMQKYTLKERMEFVKMKDLLVEAFTKDTTDILGEIYMKSGCANKATGQFFTPTDVSRLNAAFVIPKDIDENNKYRVHEPSVGSGGTVIATVAILKERGVNYQKCMEVVGQDIDWRAVYMSYVQFSFLGINAIVVQGDTLCDHYIPGVTDESRILRTPKNMGLLL